MTAAATIASLRGRLIVSCQAPAGSPLHDPYVIARFALAAERGGAAAVRIDSPDHIRAARPLCTVPIIGLHKQTHAGSDVYITPTRDAAEGVIASGADIVAIDATGRQRPGHDDLAAIVDAVRAQRPVMADVATAAQGLAALDLGVDLLATTLAGYTADTVATAGPDLALVGELARCAHVPVICEGRIRHADDVRRAFDAGAFAVVVGGAITGVDVLIRAFVDAAPGAEASIR